MKKIFLIVLGIGFIGGWWFMYQSLNHSHIPHDWFEHTIEITSLVTEDPDHGIEKSSLVLGQWGILVRSLPDPMIRFGDRITVKGKLSRPESFTTDSGRIFDYPNYLASHGIYGTLKVSQITIQSHKSQVLYDILFSLKRSFLLHIKQLFSRDTAGLLAGILVGEKSLLNEKILHDFQVAGLTHMIVLSGTNITIIASAMILFVAFLGYGYRTRYVATLGMIPLFIIMTGLDASALRAGIMALMGNILLLIHRPQHTLRSILLVVFIMFLVNPRMVAYDPSFHLSFLAFIGVAYSVPVVTRIISPEGWWGIKKLFLETFAVQATVLPYIFWMSGQVSLLSLLANLLTVPLVPLIMGLGFMATVVSYVSPFLGMMVAVPVQMMLQYIIHTASYIATFDHYIVTVPPFSGWLVMLLYTGYVVIFMRRDIMSLLHI